MTTTTLEATRQAFLDDIVAHPADDAPRLIYADWLDDHGEPERAEFIRRQIAGSHGNLRGPQFRRWFSPWWGKASFGLSSTRSSIAATLRGSAGSGGGSYGGKPDRAVVRRGFVAEARLTLDGWYGSGPGIVTQHPVERVELSDMRPQNGRLSGYVGGWYWYTYQPQPLPPACIGFGLWSLLPAVLANGGRQWAYETEEAAYDALSAACLAWARAEAARRKGER